MKRFINTLITSAVLMLAFSCQETELLEVDMNESIVLDLSSGVTKAADSHAESFVNHIDVFIFKAVGSGSDYTHGEKVYYGRYSVNNASSITLDKKRSSFDKDDRFYVYLIANSTFTEDEMIEKVGTFNDLQILKQEDAYIHLTGLSTDNSPKYFLMDALATQGDSNTCPVQLFNGEPAENTVLDAVLKRAAAKVFVNIKAGENVKFHHFANDPESDGGLYYVRNLPYDTFILSGEHAGTIEAKRRTTMKGGSNAYFSWHPEKDPENVTLAVYVYPHHWEDASILDHETCIIMNLPMIYKGGTADERYHKNSWYKIHMTDDQMFERNRYYKVDITLNAPGATSDSNPQVLDNLSYSVEEWTSVEVEVGGEDRPKYLQLNTVAMDMRNVSVDSKTLMFASSSPVSVSVKDIYYYNKFGQKVAVSPAISGTTEGGIAGNITVNSPVPDNNAIRYFTLVVTNQEDISKEVKVTQYPLEYITNVLGYYSYRDDFFYAANSSNDEDDLSVPTTWNAQGDRITTASWRNGGWSYSKGEYGGAFTSKVVNKVYDSGRDEGLADIDYYYYSRSLWGGNISKSRYNSLDPGNPRMYHVQIKATSSTYTLAVPSLDENGHTDSGADNAKLVSPSFMLASELGAVSSGEFNNYDMVASHCKEYVEVYVDPDTGQEVHLRDWRLPTRAEVEIIYKYQNDSEVMDEVLTGQYYWCADKGTVENDKTDRPGTTFLRCIRDAY